MRHFAVLGAAISSDLVITPGFSSLFPLLPTDVPQLQLAAQMKVCMYSVLEGYVLVSRVKL